MIPKIIHYCWFGGNPLPLDVEKMISTWKRHCPDYEIRQWNERNFDVYQNNYCREAYEARKWAFVSDYARLKILFEHGGIYMDTDIEVCNSLDSFLKYNAWSGFESDDSIPTGIMGSSINNEWIGYLLSYYDGASFVNQNGTFNLKTNVQTITMMTKQRYSIKLNNTFQIFGDNFALFPFDFFCAKDLIDGKVKRTGNTYTIHHFSGSWMDSRGRIKSKIRFILALIFGRNFVEILRKLYRKML